MATQNLTDMTDAQIRAEAQKILAAKAKQRERMKTRGKQKRAEIKELLAVAAAKGLLPVTPAPAAPGPKGKQ